MFQGYSDRTVDFFWQIRFNNSREWFHPRKAEFDEVIMNPTKQLAGELFEWFSERYPKLNLNVHISRIYRDARRLFGRGPLKDHIWFSFQNENETRTDSPCFWFEIGAEGYSYGMGVWGAKAAMMQRVRRVTDADPAKLDALAAAFEKQDVFALEGADYAVCKGHKGERIEKWYNKRGLSLSCRRPYDALSYSPELVEELKRGYEFLMPYFVYYQTVYKMAD